jgi:hypothetical protein
LVLLLSTDFSIHLPVSQTSCRVIPLTLSRLT